MGRASDKSKGEECESNDFSCGSTCTTKLGATGWAWIGSTGLKSEWTFVIEDGQSTSTRIGTTRSNLPSLLLTCAHLIAAVLVDPPQRHLVLPFLPILPDHLRLNLFDWTTTTGYALEERAIYQLLLPYHDNGEEEEEESATYNESSTSSDEWDDYSDSDEDPLPGGYLTPLRRFLSSPRFPYQSLTSLNLAFSPLKLPFLRSLLLSPRSIPLFPHLSHLNLAVTPNLYFVEAFFKLLSSLISLRSLSLAGKSLYPPLHLGEEEEEEEEDDALTRAHLEGFFNRLASAPRFLPRLVEATPTLQSLDLSYIPDLNINALHGIAWDRQWLDLVKLGVKTYPARTTSIELERGRRLNELGFVVKRRGEKTRKRLWLDVYY
ncbi:BZ3500_MvSof-1268-A1-R1_Chr6-3g08713 [Microbotryum saponariae]|uniref:BZ3500_MvSof-1268-A1-R1_Chr6-3g08713 protein n=1 Tax=Microbotryum saponariae TaxID=289078 RepID=A0A2X0LJS7_9BASI|nr:BZ3500_MvSof-1268-A1-R1_Chr6-3g08713 [Microbotryum saponariae]SDA07314.1 BZ3501_MvSof-1269-A2-R1_Chr6-2g08416 [Microbotryum saponariae]